jgi:hypothetical protein
VEIFPTVIALSFTDIVSDFQCTFPPLQPPSMEFDLFTNMRCLLRHSLHDVYMHGKEERRVKNVDLENDQPQDSIFPFSSWHIFLLRLSVTDRDKHSLFHKTLSVGFTKSGGIIAREFELLNNS